MCEGGADSPRKSYYNFGDLMCFFSPIISLSGLLHIRSEEKQSPNVSEGDCNMEIFFPCGNANGCYGFQSSSVRNCCFWFDTHVVNCLIVFGKAQNDVTSSPF